MAARNPGYRPIERLALETKTNLFQGLTRMLQSPHKQRPDVLFCCIILMFAMDVSSPLSAFIRSSDPAAYIHAVLPMRTRSP